MKIHRLSVATALMLSVIAFVALSGSVGAADPVTIRLGAQNNSNVSGTATLTDLGNGQTRVVVNVTGFTAGTPSPLHIHEGTCAALNPAVKFPLTDLVGGKSETTVSVALSAILAQPHAINAHKSAQEASVYISCGNIVAQGGTGGQQPGALPATGGGGMAPGSSPLAPVAIALLLSLASATTLWTLRRRAA